MRQLLSYRSYGLILILTAKLLSLWPSAPVFSAPVEKTLHYYEEGRPQPVPAVLKDSIAEIPAFFREKNPAPKITSILAGFYSSQGYFSAVIDSVVRRDKEITEWHIFADPGCRYTISKLRIDVLEENTRYQDQFTTFYGPGDYYDDLSLQGVFQKAVRHFENKGYPLARLSLKDFRIDPDSCLVTVSAQIDKGKAYTADGVLVSGLKQHNPDYVATASGIRPGDRITPQLFRKGKRNLQNTDYFFEVSDGDMVQKNGETMIHYEVREQRANRFDLMLGYTPGGSGESDIVGSGNLRIRNAGWQGSTLKMMFERLDNRVTRLETGYDRSWIRGLPLGSGLHFRFFQQDTLYQTRNIRVNNYFYWTPERKLSLSLNQENTSANITPDIPAIAFNSVTRSVGAGFTYDNTDSRFIPTRGIIFEIYAETGFRRIKDSPSDEMDNPRSMTQQYFQTSFKTHYSPFSRQVLHFAIHGRTLELPRYSKADLFPFGGAKNFRGYREEQFRAARLAWSQVEYRYLLDPWSYAFVFAAGGVYQRPDGFEGAEMDFTDELYSGGFGFSYRTPIGMMTFTYAVSNQDALYNGKVHFILSADF